MISETQKDSALLQLLKYSNEDREKGRVISSDDLKDRLSNRKKVNSNIKK